MWRLKFCNPNQYTNVIEGATRLSVSIIKTLTTHSGPDFVNEEEIFYCEWDDCEQDFDDIQGSKLSNFSRNWRRIDFYS